MCDWATCNLRLHFSGTLLGSARRTGLLPVCGRNLYNCLCSFFLCSLHLSAAQRLWTHSWPCSFYEDKQKACKHMQVSWNLTGLWWWLHQFTEESIISVFNIIFESVLFRIEFILFNIIYFLELFYFNCKLLYFRIK